MATTTASVAEICAAARAASRVLGTLDSGTRDGALEAMAAALELRAAEILEANERDMEAGREGGLDAALLDRLSLTEVRIAGIAQGVRENADLPGSRGVLVKWYQP